MIHITYKNKDKESREMMYSENNLAEVGYDIKQILDQGAENIMVFNK